MDISYGVFGGPRENFAAKLNHKLAYFSGIAGRGVVWDSLPLLLPMLLENATIGSTAMVAHAGCAETALCARAAPIRPMPRDHSIGPRVCGAGYWQSLILSGRHKIATAG